MKHDLGRADKSLSERNAIERAARRVACWLVGHVCPGWHCERCGKRIFR